MTGFVQQDLAEKGAVTAWAVHGLEGADGAWIVNGHAHLIVTARHWRHDARHGQRHPAWIGSWTAQTEVALKQPRPPRVSAYGISRIFGTYILFETNSNGTAVDVYAIHDGLIAGVVTFYIGDAIVATDRGIVGGTGSGAYSGGNVEIDYRLGLPTEAAFSQVIGLLPDSWTTSHRGDGVCTAMVSFQPVKANDYSKIYPNGLPALSIAAKWQPVFDWRDSTQSVTDPTTWKWSENAVLHTAHYLVVRDNKDWATHFAPTLAYWTAAANDCDVLMPLLGVQTVMINEQKPGDSSMLLASVNGLAAGMTIAISATGNTAKSETRTVTGVSGNTVSFSGGLSYTHPKSSQVSWTSNPASPATEARYRSCVAHKHTDDHKAVIGNLLSSFDGWLSPRSDGALMIYSGRYQSPTVTIGPDEIVSYSLQDGIDEENAINQITVTYVSANHDYATVDTDPWVDEDDIATRGKVLADALSDQVPSFSQGRRLAKRKLSRIMAPQRGSVSTNSAGRIARGQRYIHLDIIEAGTTFFSGPVEITKLTRNLSSGGVTFDWVAADPNVDEWTPATEEGQPAPVGNRIAQEPLVTPVITSATPNLGTDSGSGTSR